MKITLKALEGKKTKMKNTLNVLKNQNQEQIM
jgi:hypothetical protein